MKNLTSIIFASFFLLLSSNTYAQTSPKKSTVLISESEIISLSNVLKKYRKTSVSTEKADIKTVNNNSSIATKNEIDSLNQRITLLTELLAAQKKPVVATTAEVQKKTLTTQNKPLEEITPAPLKETVEVKKVDSKEIEKTISEKKPTNNTTELSTLQQEINELKQLVTTIAAKQNAVETPKYQTTPEIKTIVKEVPVYSEKIITKTDTVYILKTNDSFKTLDSLNMKLLNVKNNLIKDQQVQIDSLKMKLSKAKIVAPKKVEDKIEITTRKVYFNNNEFTLSELNSSLLDELIVTDTVQFYLKGYSSNSGNAKYNSILSKKRTQSVYDYLISKGVSEKAIKTESFGVDLSEKNESKARRVEIEISKI